MSNNSCYQCEDRHVGCHVDCETYNEFAKEREERRKIIHDARVKQDITYTGVMLHESRRKKKKGY